MKIFRSDYKSLRKMADEIRETHPVDDNNDDDNDDAVKVVSEPERSDEWYLLKSQEISRGLILEGRAFEDYPELFDDSRLGVTTYNECGRIWELIAREEARRKEAKARRELECKTEYERQQDEVRESQANVARHMKIMQGKYDVDDWEREFGEELDF